MIAFNKRSPFLDHPEDEMTEPEEIATAIATHLKNAMSAISGLMDELEKG